MRGAWAAGVVQMVNVTSGWTLEQQRRTVATAHRWPGVYAAVAVHPHDASHLDDALLGDLARLGRDERVVAIGETGLDYHYDRSPQAVQREAFARFLALSRELDLPVVIHTREAEADTLDVLRAEPPGSRGGVIHCFTGSLAFARACLDLGLYLSIPGVVTFRNAGELPDVVRFTPAERLLVETDSPFLAPVPYRGTTNEPRLVACTARKVAELRGESLEHVARVTTANARALFGLPPDDSPPEGRAAAPLDRHSPHA